MGEVFGWRARYQEEIGVSLEVASQGKAVSLTWSNILVIS
jgi:hypothetical protein